MRPALSGLGADEVGLNTTLTSHPAPIAIRVPAQVFDTVN